jgi:hypothetical protein
MMARFDDDDDLMAELSQAVAEERLIPPGAEDDARAAFLLRGVDEELELLTILYDSLLDQESLVRGAAHASVRTLTFKRGEFSVDIEVAEDVIIGQVIPQQSAHVTLATRAATVSSTETDEWGSFTLPRPGTGSVRLVWETGAEKLVTDWFNL